MRIGICFPSTDLVFAGFAYDLAGLIGKTILDRPEIELRRFLATGCWIHELRERLVEQALKADCDWVLFLDSDMRFPPDTLLRLLAHREAVVAVNYTTRKPPFQPVSVVVDGDQVRRVYTDTATHGLEPITTTGLGVFLVRSDLLKVLTPPRFLPGWVPDDHRYSGEDAYFCRKLVEAGATIQLDHDLSKHVRHVGLVEFEAQDAHQEVA